MTSIVDAVMASDNLDADLAATPSDAATPKARSVQRGSSLRPGAIPSEGNVPQSDIEGFEDDQVPGNSARPRRSDRPIPKVEDRVGLAVQDTFERFLET